MNFLTKIIETYKKGKRYDELAEELDEEEKYSANLNKNVKNLQTKLASTKSALQQARKSIKKLKEKGEPLPSPNELKDFFMYPDEQTRWTYRMDGTSRESVRYAFSYGSKEPIVAEAHKMVTKGGLRRKNTPTQVIDYCYRYVESNWDWDYTSDKEQFGKIEYWEKADTSLKTMRGDCDDKCVAMHMVFREVLKIVGMGDARWRIRLVASRTLSGGHAYNIWLAEDLEWYVVESTLDSEGSRARTWGNTPLRENNFYFDFYGFATPNQTWRGDMDVLEPYEDTDNKHFMEL